MNKLKKKKISLTQLLQFYTISAVAEIWSQMPGTVAWRTELKRESGFQRDGALRRSRWLCAASCAQVMADKHVSLWVTSFFLPLQLLQSKSLSKSTTLAPKTVIAEDLWFSIVFWEKGGGENSIMQVDTKNDRREKEKQLVPRPVLTSVNCHGRRTAQISSGPSDTLNPLLIPAGSWQSQPGSGCTGSPNSSLRLLRRQQSLRGRKCMVP